MTLVEEYEGKNFGEYDIAVDDTLPKEILEEDQVIEPSSKIQEQPKINENQVSLIQYPQEAPIPLAPAEDLIQYPHEKCTPPAPIHDLLPKLTMSSFLSEDPFLTITKISLHKVDLLSPKDMNQWSDLEIHLLP